MVDGFGFMLGHGCEESDASGAYTQTELGGDVETWIAIPRKYQPPDWAKYKRPVRKLRLAFYGHPLSECFWEIKVETPLFIEEWTKIPEWECCYHHKKLELVLSVYVDDFSIAGPRESLKAGWKTIQKHIVLDPPVTSNNYLGYEHA